MRFKFTDEIGDTYCVDIVARNERNSKCSKHATVHVALELANMLGSAATHYNSLECKNLRAYAEGNANEIIKAVQSL